MVIGYLPMTADLFHVGHLSAIQKAESLCDELWIGILTDGAIKKYKGKPPIIPYQERAWIVFNINPINKLRRVDKQKSIDPTNNIKERNVDILFSGDGFTDEERNAAKKLGVTLCEFPYHKGQSTTKIKQRVIEQNTKK